MKDLLIAVKMKNNNGTYSDSIPFGVSADNVNWDVNHNLIDILGTIDLSKGSIQTQLSSMQNMLDMDVTPTTGSSKPVTSGGIKAALDLIDEDISSLNEDITNLDEKINGTEAGTQDVTSSVEWTNGYSVFYLTGQLQAKSNYSAADIPLGNATHVSGYTRAGQDSTQGLCFLDSNGNWISGDYHEGASSYDWNYDFDVPAGATILRICCTTQRLSDFTCVLTMGTSSGLAAEVEQLRSDLDDLSVGDLSDTAVSNPSDGQVLSYDGTTGKWKNSGSTITVDSNLSTSSVNPVQNKVVAKAISDIDETINGSGSRTEDITATVNWISGKSVIWSNGQYYEDAGRSSADIPVSGASHVSGYTRAGVETSFGLCFLDANGIWLSGDYHKDASSYDWNYSFDVPENAEILRISCTTSRIPDFTCVLTFNASDGLAAEVEKLKRDIDDISVDTDTTLSISGEPADAKATGDAIAANSSDISAIDAQINGSGSGTDNLVPSAVWSEDYHSVDANTGRIVSNSSQYSAAQIDVSGYSRVYGYTRGGQASNQGLAFVTLDGVLISGDYHAGSGTYDWNYDFEVPTDAKYLRISCFTARKSQFTCTGEKTVSDGIVAQISAIEDDLSNLTKSSVSFGSIAGYTWKDGYRVTIYGNDAAVSNYSYTLIDVKALQGHTISGYTRANADLPALAFFDDNNRIIATDFNPSASSYDYNYSVIVPQGASYVKISCSTARKADFSINVSAVPLLDSLSNIARTAPQNYRASESVQALKGSRADFDALSNTRLQDVYDWYDRLVSCFPSRLVRTQIGTSSTPTGSYAAKDSNTYPIYAYVWTGKSAKPENKFILAGGIHGPVDTSGDGIQGVIAMAYFIEDLFFHPDKNDYMRKICEECTIVMIPVLNPWGYQVGYRCNGRGVDCNRNFDYNWAEGTSYGYSCGTEAFSENETAALRDYISTNHLDAKFFCEIHSRGRAVLPDDDRWEILCLSDGTYAGLLDLVKTTGAEMTECYGGVTGWSTYTESDANPTCYTYFDYVKHIPCYEPEFFRSCNMDENMLDSRWVQIQCVSWMGSMVQTLADHFCTF